MKILKRTVLAGVALSAATLWAASDPGVTFIGRGEIPGNALDKSGLAGKTICSLADPANCVDQAVLGGLGSAFTYTGHDNVYLATPDRGPFDGRTNVPYLDRFHLLHMTVDTTKNPNTGVLNISWNLLATRFLKNELGRNLLGGSSEFNLVNPLRNFRFDPEGVRTSLLGNFFVSDEYGPYVYEFTRLGRLIRRIRVPSKFLIDNPTGDVNDKGDSFELYKKTAPPTPYLGYGNDSGRQANRGMEGLAITPNGRYLVGVMQNALIQDNGLSYADPQTSSTTPSRVSLNNRILKYDLLTGRTWEYVYVMDAISQGKGVNEILAVNDHQFLVLERDNRSLVSPGADPFSTSGSNCCGLKRIYKIDLNGATDVSGFDSLVGKTFTPVSKSLFIDLLNPAYEVDISTTPHKTIKQVIAEKIEGLAWGPKLPNGHLVLYVMSDNDLNTTFPTQIFAFEIDPGPAGANFIYDAQDTPVPFISGMRVRRILAGQDDDKDDDE